MNTEKPWLTPQEAAQLLEMTPRNVKLLITSGKIKATREANGRYYIEKKDFFTEYPWLMNKEIPGNEKTKEEKLDRKLLEEKNNHLEEIRKEQSKQIDYLKSLLETDKIEKHKMLEAISSQTRLLEYKEKKEKSPIEPAQEIKTVKSKWYKLFIK